MHAPSSPSIGFPPPSPLAHTVKPCLMSTLIHTHQNTSCPTQGRNLNDVGGFFEGQQRLSPISPESSGTDRNEPRLNQEDLASTNSPSSHACLANPAVRRAHESWTCLCLPYRRPRGTLPRRHQINQATCHRRQDPSTKPMAI